MTSYDGATGRHSVTNQTTGDRRSISLVERKYSIVDSAGGAARATAAAVDEDDDEDGWGPEITGHTSVPASMAPVTAPAPAPITSAYAYQNPYYQTTSYGGYSGGYSYIPTLTYKAKNPQVRQTSASRWQGRWRVGLLG